MVIGLGSMLGAGVFVTAAPAADVAGSWLLVGLVIAGGVAFANASSSAQLAARHPESGGTYVYARKRLGPAWGFLAGWAFVVGKCASLSAIALTLGTYVAPGAAKAVGIITVVAMTAVNYRGVEKTARLTKAIVAVVLVTLTLVVVATFGGGGTDIGHLTGSAPDGALGVLRSAGFLFFAFAGYARIATLGEEVREPERAIPRAIPIALGAVLAIYAVVMVGALVAVGPAVLARSAAPLVTAVQTGRFDEAAFVVRGGAAVASLGVLLSLLAGTSRTGFAMARRRDAPVFLDAVHPRFRTPHRAELAVATVVCVVVALADIREAIGFSSFAVLGYYALTNASALTLSSAELRWPRWIAVAGLAGCTALALSLPLNAVGGGSALLAAGGLVWLARRGRIRRP